MSIEQSNNEEYYQKKKKKLEDTASQDFFESQKLKAETSNLLQSLAKDISIKFGIDIGEVKKLIENKTTSNLEDLQSSLGNNEIIDVSDLLSDINSAKYQIEDLSKQFRDELKKSIDQNAFEPEKHEYVTSQRIFSRVFMKKIKNPQNITDNILGAGVGIIDSTEAVIFFLYGLGKGILLTPYHMYLLLKSKAKMKI